MTHFEAKMHRIRFRLGHSPRTRLEAYSASCRLPSWISGSTKKKEAKLRRADTDNSNIIENGRKGIGTEE